MELDQLVVMILYRTWRKANPNKQPGEYEYCCTASQSP